jgi:hypothetical protein
MSDEFFIGWAETPRTDRRFLLGAALGLTAFGAGAGVLLARAQSNPGDGLWDMGAVKDWAGHLVRAPYPALRTFGIDGRPRTAYLGTMGKMGVADLLPANVAGDVIVRGSLIVRGANAMIAVDPATSWIKAASTGDASLGAWREEGIGPAALAGEILDSKCWFGAMKPAQGKSHKSCASLCVRGGLPAVFCEGAACGAALSQPVLTDENGHAHGEGLLALVADPVFVSGTFVRVGDVMQLRAALGDIRRI